ncbi:MAG: c-type cytochrome [Gammaproteobacteria bacterium]|nr:c-type cytochrome [Gammaproteobacteria bacterium]
MRSLSLVSSWTVLSWMVGSFAHSADEIVTAPSGLEHCVVCHGVELKGNRSVDAPNLSVLNGWYVENQLRSYQRGTRAPHGSTDLIGREMQPMATALNDSDVARVLDFLSEVPARNAPTTVRGDPKRGAELFVSCMSCHGAEGEGNQTLNGPRLAGQSDWYLVQQLENFRSGARGAEPGDLYGAQMRISTSILTNAAAINDVVTYINSLTNQEN